MLKLCVCLIFSSLQKDLRKLEALNGNLETTKSQIILLERQRDTIRLEKKTLDQQLLTLRTARSRFKIRSEELMEMRRENNIDPEAEQMAAKQKISVSFGTLHLIQQIIFLYGLPHFNSCIFCSTISLLGEP